MEQNQEKIEATGTNQEVKKQQGVSTGAAILTAGVLIAGAILFTHYDTKGTPTATKEASQSDTLDVSKFAVQAGVNKDDFLQCYNNSTFAKRVTDDAEAGTKLGIQGTPTSYIIDASGINTFSFEGAYPYTELKKKVDLIIANTTNTKLTGTKDVKVPAVTAEDHVFGDITKAKVYIIEYSDLQCPFCKQFNPGVQKLVTDYQGQVAWIYRHFPLESIHDNARPLAEASECVAKIGGNDAFWKFEFAVMNSK